jgi:hypothetical protein
MSSSPLSLPNNDSSSNDDEVEKMLTSSDDSSSGMVSFDGSPPWSCDEEGFEEEE